MEPDAALARVAAQAPEPVERASEPRRVDHAIRRQQPVQGRFQIRLLRLQAVQPGRPVLAVEVRLGTLRQGQEIGGMGRLRRRCFASVSQALQGVFAHDLEHPEARLCVRGRHALKQMVVGQRLQPVEDGGRRVKGFGERFSRLQ